MVNNTSVLPINAEAAFSFLSRFNHNLYTFQILKNSKPVKVFTRKNLNFLKTKLAEFQELSDQGNEFFFMVNEGDGVVYPPHTTARSQQNVTHLSALFIDTDACPFDKIKAYLKSKSLVPHFVLETSPHRYHVYFLLEKTPASKQNLKKWQACQLSLIHLGDTSLTPTGIDASMRDWSRVLRIPGFYHRKKAPFLVTTQKEYDHRLYTLNDIYEALDGGDFLEAAAVKGSSTSYQPSHATVTEGSRHAEMTSFISHLLNKEVSKEIVLYAFYKYAEEKFSNPKEFLPNGPRNHEVINFIDWKLQTLEKEKEEKQRQQLRLTLATPQSTVKDLFELPDSFYEEAPGMLGQIVKEITQKARYPIHSFAFGTALGAVGALKAKATTTNLGHAPSNYFLCLSATGSGKNYAQEILTHTFNKLGISRYIASGVSSAKGISRFLEQNDSIGMLSLDEAENFFTTFADKYAPHYLKACKSILLEIYTSTNMPYKCLGYTGDAKQKPIILKYSRLNILAYGVLNTLSKAFTVESIQDGLLQRFLVLTNFKDLKRNEKFEPAKSLSGDIFEYFKLLTKKLMFSTEEDFLATQDLEAQLKAELDEHKKKRIAEQLSALTVKPLSKLKIVKFTSEAKKLYDSYADSMDIKRNSEMKTQSNLEGLYTRAAEQIGRLCAVACEEEITKNHVDYFITFVDSRVNALKEYCTEQYSGELNKNASYFLDSVAKFMQKKGVSTVTKRDIYKNVKFRNSKELNDILYFLLDSGDLIEVKENKLRAGPRGKRYSLGEIN